MVEQAAFRVEAAAVLAADGPDGPAACPACVVAPLDMSPEAVRWEQKEAGLLGLSLSPVVSSQIPLLAVVSEAVVARPAVVGRCGVDTDWMRRQVPGTATLF